MHSNHKIITLIAALFLSGCSGKLFTVYKIDVQQGNAVEIEKVEQLELGMTKEQVKFLLGTPLITDVFHPDRWDYVYFLLPGYGERERRHLVVYFEGDSVANIMKDQMEAPAAENKDSENTES